jgi:hypothetical protein
LPAKNEKLAIPNPGLEKVVQFCLTFPSGLYKYPQAGFPYAELEAENRQRGRGGMEYELLDTEVFDNNNYYDVFVEYAKNTPEDILIKITITNHSRGERLSPTEILHLLPTLYRS